MKKCCPSDIKCPIKVDYKVNHPSHYNYGNIEVISAIEDWNLGFHLGNVIKYVARAERKNYQTEKQIEDLRKAKWYLERFIMIKEQQLIKENAQRCSIGRTGSSGTC